jgi:hypothetical protein
MEILETPQVYPNLVAYEFEVLIFILVGYPNFTGLNLGKEKSSPPFVMPNKIIIYLKLAIAGMR